MAFLRLTIPPWLVQLGITLAVLLGAFVAGRMLNRLLLDWLEQFSKRQEMPGQRIYATASGAARHQQLGEPRTDGQHGA